MRTILTRIEYACFAVSIITLIFTWFLVGDTDIISEPPPWVTTVLMASACLFAVTGAILHWAGLPMQEVVKKEKKK